MRTLYLDIIGNYRVLNVGGAHEPGVVEGDVLGVPGDVVAGQRVVVNKSTQHQLD